MLQMTTAVVSVHVALIIAEGGGDHQPSYVSSVDAQMHREDSRGDDC